ncbi:YeiH family protein [Hominifimenecus sp. rT4P-3]|uniref:YeiH family protein n=1 Tax=Hominifimenecus sp. rT4P-3 TaxID=3242979 RepID=UPI003DA6B3AC
MNSEKWWVILACIVVAYGYAWLLDCKQKKGFSAKRYGAITLCLGIGIAATWLGSLQSVIGGPMIGLFIGMLFVNLLPSLDADFKAGTTLAAKKYLNLGIVLVGATLNYAAILSATKSLPLLLFNICLSFGVASLIGKKVMKLNSNVCTLVGGGTCICGGSAIATIASIIKAKEEEIAYAMTAIFLFDVLAALMYPYLADWIGLNAQQFGYLAGAAVNDTSSVVASQSTYMALHPEIGEFSLGITVKLVRTTLILLLAVIFTILAIRKAASQETGEKASIGGTIRKVFPWFILVFLVMALVNTLGIFDKIPGAAIFFKHGNKFFVTVALAGVGFKIKFKDLFSKGKKPIALGGCTWLAVFLSSLLFVVLFKDFIQA